MMTPKGYLSAVQDAFDRSRQKTHDLTGRPLADAEELVSQLAIRGLMVVEKPAGLDAEYRGVPRAVLE